MRAFTYKFESFINPTPLVHIPSIHVPIVTPYQTPRRNIPLAMAARFAPLVLPAQLHDLPQAYSQRIKTFGAEGDITTQQHLNRFNDLCDLEEVDYEDAKLRLFAQNFLERSRNGLEEFKLEAFVISRNLKQFF